MKKAAGLLFPFHLLGLSSLCHDILDLLPIPSHVDQGCLQFRVAQEVLCGNLSEVPSDTSAGAVTEAVRMPAVLFVPCQHLCMVGVIGVLSVLGDVFRSLLVRPVLRIRIRQ